MSPLTEKDRAVVCYVPSGFAVATIYTSPTTISFLDHICPDNLIGRAYGKTPTLLSRVESTTNATDTN